MDELHIKIIGWDDYNPRKDLTAPSWFRLNHDFFEHPSFYGLTLVERVCWIYLLCERSKHRRRREQGEYFTVNTQHAHRVAGIDTTMLASTLKKLAKQHVVEVRKSRMRYAAVQNLGRTRRDGRDETRRDETDIPRAGGGDPQDIVVVGQEKSDKKKDQALPNLAAMWNVLAHPSMPRVLAMSRGSVRRKMAEARWDENPSGPYWEGVIKRMNQSPFCRGEVPGRDGGKPFVADIEFFCRPDTHAKILEGKYDAKGSKPADHRANLTPEERAGVERQEKILREHNERYGL